jgi:hypothetical protein
MHSNMLGAAVAHIRWDRHAQQDLDTPHSLSGRATADVRS